VHINDNYGLKDEHNLPGDGNINWSKISRELLKLSFLHNAVCEVGISDASQSGKKAKLFLEKHGWIFKEV